MTANQSNADTRPNSAPREAEAPPKMTMSAILPLLKQTWAERSEDKAPRLGAAFAYYTIFSLAPLLIVIITIAGFVFGEEAARGQIATEISDNIGEEAAQAIQAMIDAAGKQKSTGTFASIAGIVTLLLGSSALFGQLQDALNTIWEVAPKPNLGWMNTIRQRFLSFSMVLGVGFLLLVSLAASAAVAALGTWMSGRLPIPEFALQALTFIISFLVATLLFAMMYKVLPDAEVQWRDVWVGAALTSLLFGLGRFALGLYLGKSGVSSAYGAAGSLVLILLWVYYAAQILFFGAEFTQVYANSYGSKVRPSENAIPVTDDKRAQEGLPRLSDLHSTEVAANAVRDGKTVRKVEPWTPSDGATDKRKTAVSKNAPQSTLEPSSANSSPSRRAAVDGHDMEYLGAAALAFVATLWFSSRRHRHDADEE